MNSEQYLLKRAELYIAVYTACKSSDLPQRFNYANESATAAVADFDSLFGVARKVAGISTDYGHGSRQP